MEEKKMRLALWFGIIVISAGIVYAFWANCIVPLKGGLARVSAKTNEVSRKAINSNFDARLIYLYFSDWDVRTVPDGSVEIDRKIVANRSFKMHLSLRQENSIKLGVQYVSVVFSTNTAIYSDAAKKTSWIDSGRTDAKEFRYDIYSIMPRDSKVDMPALDIMFKTSGLYEMKYMIMLENFEKVEGACTFTITENE